MRTREILFGLCLTGGAAGVLAHGVMSDPPSRMWTCGYETQVHHIVNGTAKTPACSTAFAFNPQAPYNFMAVVTHTWGRAKLNPLPKNVCGFDGESWKGAKTPWDIAMAWPATQVAAGPKTITWDISWGPHFDDTQEFRYWITKPGFVFSPTRELTWDDFETEPFCMELYDDKNPTGNPDITVDKTNIKFTTRCNVPARTGRHVIYGEWGRTEATLQRFHGCIDVVFGPTPVRPGGAKADGTATPAGPAKPGVDALGREPGAADGAPPRVRRFAPRTAAP